MDLSGGAGGGISISKWRPPKHIRFTFPRGNLALLSRLSVKTKRDEDERSGASPLLHRTPRRVITACWPVSVSVSVGPHEGAVAASHFQGEESRRAHHFMSYVHVRSRSTCLRNACFDSTKLRSLVPPPRDVVKMAHGRAVHGDMERLKSGKTKAKGKISSRLSVYVVYVVQSQGGMAFLFYYIQIRPDYFPSKSLQKCIMHGTLMHCSTAVVVRFVLHLPAAVL